MQIAILIEPVPGDRFHARSGEPLPLEAEGATREEALAKMTELLEKRLAGGAELTVVEVGQPAFARFAGWLANDPLFEEWQQAIAENRRQDDEAEGVR